MLEDLYSHCDFVHPGDGACRSAHCSSVRFLARAASRFARHRLMNRACMPIGPGTRRMNVRYYLVAVLFILFDVEIIFFYPWAVNFRALGLFGFVEMLVFVGILLVGYVYVWKKGAFEWD